MNAEVWPSLGDERCLPGSVGILVVLIDIAETCYRHCPSRGFNVLLWRNAWLN